MHVDEVSKLLELISGGPNEISSVLKRISGGMENISDISFKMFDISSKYVRAWIPSNPVLRGRHVFFLVFFDSSDEYLPLRSLIRFKHSLARSTASAATDGT